MSLPSLHSPPSRAVSAWRSAGAFPVEPGGDVRLGVGHDRVEVVVDEQTPHVLVRVVADEVLDVDAAIAQDAALAIGLGDLRLDRDDALEAGLELCGLAHPRETLPDRDSRMVQLRSPRRWPTASPSFPATGPGRS